MAIAPIIAAEVATGAVEVASVAAVAEAGTVAVTASASAGGGGMAAAAGGGGGLAAGGGSSSLLVLGWVGFVGILVVGGISYLLYKWKGKVRKVPANEVEMVK